MKRPLLLILALALLVGANLKLCCTVSVCGIKIPGRYSEDTISRAAETAQRCAEEICPGQNESPEIKKKYLLSFKEPDGTAEELSDAILKASPGIERCWCVYSNGRFLGTVESKEVLEERMRAYIMNTMPTGASDGAFSGTVSIERAYTRAAAMTSPQDMVLLLSGAAPVIYTDPYGKIVAG